MSDPRASITSPIMFALMLVLACVATGAMAKGAGFGKGSQPAHSQPTLMSTGAGSSALLGMPPSSGAKATAPKGAQVMATMPMSQTTMASHSGSPTTVKLMTGTPAAPRLVFLIPTLMATSPLNPALAARATAAITNSHSSVKHSSAPTNASWASSGTVWPTLAAGDSGHSGGKGQAMPKPTALTTWPAVDTSASRNASTH
jgi:hypothetical protein